MDLRCSQQEIRVVRARPQQERVLGERFGMPLLPAQRTGELKARIEIMGLLHQL